MAFFAPRGIWAWPRPTHLLVTKVMHQPSVVGLHPNTHRTRSPVVPLQQDRIPVAHTVMVPQIPLGGNGNVKHSRFFTTHPLAGNAYGTKGYDSTRNAFSKRQGARKLLILRRRLASRLYSLETEEWVFLLISLGWCGVLGGAAAFSGWRSATREVRHPYLSDTKSILQSDRRVTELLGVPLDVRVVEEHSETFAAWKRLVLQLSGPKGSAKAFVSARRVGYSEEDLFEKIAGEEDEGPLWSRPYLLKQWLLQGVSDLYELVRQLSSPDGKAESGGSSGVGKWEVDSLFVLHPPTAAAGAGTPEDFPAVIACKGRPADNPDWCKSFPWIVVSLPHSVFEKLPLRVSVRHRHHVLQGLAFLGTIYCTYWAAPIAAGACDLLFSDRLLPPEHSTEKLLTHWVANTCLLFLILYSMKRVRAEWKMAAERVSR